MATLSSHTLDCVNGAHAGGVEVELIRITASGHRTRVFLCTTDEGGRLNEQVPLTPVQCAERYEMVFKTGAYFAGHPNADLGERLVDEVAVRFRMPEAQGKYHIPMMLAPNSCSVWWSGEQG